VVNFARPWTKSWRVDSMLPGWWKIPALRFPAEACAEGTHGDSG
jgi:hypothetical protein